MALATYKNTFRSIIGVCLIGMFIIVPLTAQDTSISVTPAYILFADETPGNQSDPVTITVKNEGYISGVSLGNISMDTSHSSHFNISTDNCSMQTLAQNSSCTMQVKFIPQSTGIKSTVMRIPYNDTNLSIFLSNDEDIESEAKRRLPPIVYDLSVPEELNASTTYDMNWTAMGYHSGYKTVIAMFDCTNVPAGECGAAYGSDNMFYASSYIDASETTVGEWSYNGEAIQNFKFSHSYLIPSVRPYDDGPWPVEGTPIVIRLYINSIEDIEAGKTGLSLIVPGNLSNDYYDTSGRKIQKIICPVGGCTP